MLASRCMRACLEGLPSVVASYIHLISQFRSVFSPEICGAFMNAKPEAKDAQTQTRKGFLDVGITDDSVKGQRPGKWLLVFAVIGFLGAIIFGLENRSAHSETDYTYTVSVGDIVETIAIEGVVATEEQRLLRSEYSGRLTLSVNEGDVVAQGSELLSIKNQSLESEFELDEIGIRARVAELNREKIEFLDRSEKLKQSLNFALVKLRAAERELARSKRAFQGGVIAEREIDIRKDELELARSQFSSAEQSHLRSAEQLEVMREYWAQQSRLLSAQSAEIIRKRERLIVRSPIDGVVSILFVRHGEVVDEGKDLLIVANPDGLYALLRVPERHLEKIAVGVEGIGRVVGGEQFRGEVKSVSPSIIDGFAAAKFKTDADGELNQKLNQRVVVEAQIILREEVVRLPVGALVNLDIRAGVATVMVSGNQRSADIRIGIRGDEFVEVISGLSTGQEIYGSFDTD